MRPDPKRASHATWNGALRRAAARASQESPIVVEGLLTRAVGLTVEAVGCSAPVGSRCDVITDDGARIETEVVGFAGERLFLMPTRAVASIAPGARVVPREDVSRLHFGDEALGRVLNGRGEVIDGGGPIHGDDRLDIVHRPVNPLQRAPIDESLDVGIRSINGLLTLGRGQRIGLFAGSGVGKSMLLGMLTRFTKADVVVVGLIGERGREVSEFVNETLGEAGLRKAVVVATPADDTPLMRLNGAWLATAVAEYFRDQGRHVLLLVDSLTRFAQAQREIGLATGEPPTTKGYPPSVFAKLPQLVERAGNAAAGAGSITAIYTVLAEGDDQHDPIADAARAILDGHLVLSRALAESGVFPAIDIERSVSRAAHRLTTAAQQQRVATVREQLALYRRNEDLIAIGAYQRGSDPSVDRAIQLEPEIRSYLKQGLDERCSLAESAAALERLVSFDAAAAAG